MGNRFLIIVFLIPVLFSGCGQEGSLYPPAEQKKSAHQYDVFLLQKTPVTPDVQATSNPQQAAPDAQTTKPQTEKAE